jgi:hypothetical protein
MSQYHATDRASHRASHTSHKRVLRIRVSGHFAGKRMRTEIERCKTCSGKLLSIVQFAVGAGQS